VAASAAFAAALALCACSPTSPPAKPAADDAGAFPARQPMPLAHIGPDVRMAVPCGGTESRVIASVSDLGGDCFTFSATIAGDPAFTTESLSRIACPNDGTWTVPVQFTAPPNDSLGASHDAVVTVQSEHDVFPPMTVAVHAYIVAVDVVVEPLDFEFGSVSSNPYPVGVLPIHIHNRNETTVHLTSQPTGGRFAIPDGPPILPGRWTDYQIETLGPQPGEISETLRLAFSGGSGAGDACDQIFVVHAHAIIVPDAGSPDGGGGLDSGAPAMDAGNQ
jgi:hypothetical protein